MMGDDETDDPYIIRDKFHDDDQLPVFPSPTTTKKFPSAPPIYAAPTGIPPAPPDADAFHLQTPPATIQEMRIYSSTVEIPSVYTEKKHAEYGTWKYFLRKLSGIPFAIAYGFFLIWIISDYIFDKPDEIFRFKLPPQNITKNVCASFYPPNVSFDLDFSTTQVPSNVRFKQPQRIPMLQYRTHRDSPLLDSSKDIGNTSYTPVYFPRAARLQSSRIEEEEDEENYEFARLSSDDPSSNTTTEKKQHNTSVLFSNDSIELIAIVGGVMFLLGISSIFSRNIKATMLLILPGLITRHARHLIFTIVWGVLSTGPMSNMMYNFKKLLEDAGCMYKYVVFLACIKQKKFNIMADNVHRLYNLFLEMIEVLDRIRCQGPPGSCQPKPKSPLGNSTWDMIQSLTGPSTVGIKNMAGEVVDQLDELFFYFGNVRKMLTIITMVLLVIDAIRYLRSYYIDSSFDNMYIGWSTRR